MAKKKESELKAYNSNMYIQLRRDFSIIQKRVIHFVVKQLQDEMYNLNNQKATGKPIERTLFGDCYFHIPSTAIDPLNQDSNIRIALKGLMLPLENTTTIGHFLMKATRLDGQWRLLFNEEAVHFLTEVSKGVTPLATILYLSAQSKYTIRLYELLMQFRNTGKWYTTPEDLAELLGVPEIYKKNFAQFKLKAINVAKDELKELYDKKQSEIYFGYTEKRGGRGDKVQQLEFSIFYRDKVFKADIQEAEHLSYLSIQLQRIMIDDTPAKFHKANKEYISRVLSKLTEKKALKIFADKLEKRIILNTKVPSENKGALVKYILEDEFGIE